jgi:hypothetical protein
VDGSIYPWPPDDIKQPVVEILDVQTAPLVGDEFGQVASGYIYLRGKAFLIPDIDRILEHMWEEVWQLDAWHLGLDDYSLPDELDETHFLPLAELESDLVDDKYVFWGLLLHSVENPSGFQTFQRIGFARVSRDGSIAGSGYDVHSWIPPPWPPENLGIIKLI